MRENDALLLRKRMQSEIAVHVMRQTLSREHQLELGLRDYRSILLIEAMWPKCFGQQSVGANRILCSWAEPDVVQLVLQFAMRSNAVRSRSRA